MSFSRASTFGTLCLLWIVVGLPAPPVVAAEFAGGTGEPADPYLIATAEQLLSIGNDKELLEKHFRLVDDIDLDPSVPGGQVFADAVIAYGSDPYASGRRKFTGRLYGDGHAIRNLTIDNTEGQFHGLFGYIGSGGRVYDLNLEGVRIASGGRAGALAGRSDGSIVNCSASGSITGGDHSSWLGGLIGINAGGITGSRTDVHVACGVGGFLVGGLTGLHRGRIINCSATGSVSGGNNAFHLGGLVGMSLGGAVEDSDADGFVSAGDRSWGLGGLLGRQDSEGLTIRCYATGDVAGGRASRDLGGLAGQNWYGSISYSYSLGGVTVGEDSHTVGGFVGSCLGGDITACYATGSVTGSRGGRFLGGLAGQVQAASTVSNCYAISRVFRGTGLHGHGGLVGHVAGGRDVQVTQCFWDAEASGASASAAGQGLTTEQMQDSRTYQAAGWDLLGDRADGTADIWHVPEGGQYPALTLFFDPNALHVLEGAGKSYDPYIIATAEDLGAVVRHGRFAWFKLAADIDLADITWRKAPIPFFDGVFDGNGRRIRNLTVQSSGPGPVGLFGRIASGAWVYDLGLEDVSIVGDDGSSELGGVAGTNAGNVVGCFVTGSISGGAGSRSLGGLVGANRQGTIGDCYATATVTGGPGSRQLGGLVGYNYLGPIVTCYAAGTVSIADGAERLGGLTGYTAEPTPTVNSFFLAASVNGGHDNTGGSPLTDEQMKRPDSFTDWDFAKTWMICEGQTYPHLLWEQIECDP